jgi:hypothetical protein
MIGWDWPVQAAYTLVQPIAADDPLHERSRLGTPYAEPAEPGEHDLRDADDALEPARPSPHDPRIERVVVLGNWFT